MELFFVNAAVIVLLSMVPSLYRPSLRGDRPVNLYLYLAMGYLAMLAVLRADSVGTDTKNYINVFHIIGKQKDLLKYLRFTGYEKGFVTYVWLLMRVFHSPQLIIMLSSGFMFFSVGRFFSRHSKVEWISVYLFFTLMIFDFFLSGFRQAMAISILTFAYDEALRRRWFPFLLLASLATLFHTTAIIIFAVYPIASVRNDRLFFTGLILFGVIVMAFWPMILQGLLRVFPKYRYYLGDSEFSSDGKLAVFSKMSVYLVVLLAGILIRPRKDAPPLSPEDRVAQRLVSLLPIICMMSMRATVISRFFRYFEIFAAVYVPNVVLLRKDQRTKGLLALLVVVLFFLYALVVQLLRTPEWQQTYPYHFFWQAG